MTQKQQRRADAERSERALRKAIALEVASFYCRENGLSVEKLRQQRFEWLGDMAVFAQPSSVRPNGLLNDLETQPIPTLVLREKDGEIAFEQTEHTKRYLAQ